jgi:hypothetical protein
MSLSDALANMILGGLTPEEALLRNRRDLLARMRGEVVAEVVTQRSGRGYFLSTEEEIAARHAPAVNGVAQPSKAQSSH